MATEPAEAPADTVTHRPSPVAWIRQQRFALAAIALTSLPVVVAGSRAAWRGWIPISDNAIISLRSDDVLTAHHPLLGTRSSASSGADLDLNHPGPLLFDALALPVRLFGGHAGVALGVVLVNVVAAAVTGLFAHRIGGRTGASIAMLVFAFVAFTMGSELLFDPWNPHVLILPCVALIVTAWGIACRDGWALPAYLAVGSFCLQTHLGYVYLVPLVLVGALVVGWRLPVEPADDAPGDSWRGSLAWSAGVVVVLWAQPLWEQLFGHGKGNLARLLSAAIDNESTAIGPALGFRLVASVLTTPPWSARDGFVDAVPFTLQDETGALERVDTVGLLAAVALLAVTALVVAGAARLSWRHRDRVSLAALAIGTIGIGVALVSVSLMPISPIGLSPHQMRWLWPLSAWVWGSVAFALVRQLPPGREAQVRIGALVLTAALAALALPNFVQPVGPAERAWQIPIVADLERQLAVLDDRGPILVDTSNVPLYDAYSAAMIAELGRRDIPFRVAEETLVRQFGERRRFDDDADVRLYLLQGRAALDVPDGDERVAFSTPLGPAELEEFLALEAELIDAVASEGVRLSAAGADAVGPTELSRPPGEIVTSGDLARWWDLGFVDADGDLAAALTRYSELRVGSEFATVAVLVSPI